MTIVMQYIMDFVQVLAQCFLVVNYDNYKITCYQYCIACNVSALDCSHNRVSSLASLGQLRFWKKEFAQVPLTGLEVRNSTVLDV